MYNEVILDSPLFFEVLFWGFNFHFLFCGFVWECVSGRKEFVIIEYACLCHHKENILAVFFSASLSCLVFHYAA